MSGVAALTLRDAILPLTNSFVASELSTVKVEHHWTSGNAANARDHSYKMYLPTCDDPAKKELFFCVIDQFLDGMSDDRLHLSTGPQRYSKFRLVMEQSLRLQWQTISAGRANKTVDSFNEDLRAFIALYFAESARDDQLEYLRTAIKPYNMTTEMLSSRLKVLSRLGRLLPGSCDSTAGANNNLCANETEHKRALFQLMPMSWRIEFAKTTHRLDDDAYTYHMLTRYFALQEAIEKRSRGTKRSRDVAGRGRGSGRGRGPGRGRGRGDPNRGRGRGCHGRGYYSNNMR